MKKLCASLLVALSLVGFVAGDSFAAPKVPVIVASSIDDNPKHYPNVWYYKFVELAQKYSNNAFDFQLFPSMQLGNEQESVRGLLLGTINMTNVATNNFSPFAPSCGWVNMPYMFESLDDFRSLVDAMWDQHTEWAIKEGGARPLSILEVGYRQLTTGAKYPVRKLADAKGVKIRVPQNPLMVSTFQALGLEPAAVPFSETFNALQQGVVDGQEGCLNNVISMKFYEAQKYATLINWSIHSCNWLASEQWFQSLPANLQDALKRAGIEAMHYQRSKVAGILAADDKILESHGMVLLGEVEDMPEWFRLGRTAWPKCYEVIGAGNAEKGKAIVDMVMAKKAEISKK
ncbi:MAG: TRAP transporter substrate-binding protein [Mailhella sp.]|nr:TRAP transporter substrate-binding protein [Mailhella sp.]MBQ9105877.1 TRAP transporter substrate-binding protein [Mailhella sp.]